MYTARMNEQKYKSATQYGTVEYIIHGNYHLVT